MTDFFYSQGAAQLQSNMDKVSATTGDLIDENNLDSNVGALGYTKSTNYAYFRDERVSGTNAGTSVAGTQPRVLNTTVTNNITGCSLSSNQVTLDAGDYYIRARAPAIFVSGHKASIYNTSTSTTELIGASAFNGASVVHTDSTLQGFLTVTSLHVFELRHYTANSVASNGLGVSSSSGLAEVYAELEIWRLT